MKTKINELVVDDSMEFKSSVKEYFKNNAVIKIVDVVTDGEKAVDYIKEHQDNIDVILMDLIIPGKDGLQILEELEELKIKKHLIILSSYRKDYTIRMTSRFNVDYYMLKPINLNSLENRQFPPSTGPARTYSFPYCFCLNPGARLGRCCPDRPEWLF